MEISVEKEYNQHALNLQCEIDGRLARFRPTLSLSSFFCFELSMRSYACRHHAASHACCESCMLARAPAAQLANAAAIRQPLMR